MAKKKSTAKGKKKVIEEVKEEIKKENKSFKKIYFVTSYERTIPLEVQWNAYQIMGGKLQETIDFTLTEEENPSLFGVLKQLDDKKKELEEAKKTILDMKAAIKKVNDFSGE